MGDKRQSLAWDCFAKLGNFRAKCNYCHKILSYRGGGGPYNLLRHTKTVHNVSYKKLLENRQTSSVPKEELSEEATSSLISTIKIEPDDDQTQSTSTSNDAQTQNTSTSDNTQTQTTSASDYQQKRTKSTSDFPQKMSSSRKAELLNYRLLKVICSNYLQFSFIENEAVTELFEDIIANYKLPSYQALTTTLNKQFEVTKNMVQEELKDINYIALSTDFWTAESSTRYMALTCHFLCKYTQLKSFTLASPEITETETGSNFEEKIMETCKEWGISEKIVAITTNNDINIENPNFQQIFCLGHTMNLVIQKGLLSISDTLAKIRELVQYFQNNRTFRKLELEQIKNNEKSLQLKMDDTTRWNSTYHMFQRVIVVKDSLLSLLADECEEMPQITGEDMEIMTSACDLLNIFERVSIDMCSDLNINIPKLALISNALIFKCEKFLTTNKLPISVREMTEAILKDLKIRFKDLDKNTIISESIILDPRFKNYGFSNSSAYDAALEKFRDKLKSVKSNTSDKETNDDNTPPKEDNNDFWDFLNIPIEEAKKTDSPNNELDLYLQEPFIFRNKDPLQWWDQHKSVYPTLYEIVKQRFCIMATSVPPERLFTKTGQFLTDQRTLLEEEKIEKVVFLNQNM